MGLRLEDRWIWDFWFCDDGDDLHVFYLQAPKSLGDPERRHRNATIGHAKTRDLVTWEFLPDPLGLGAPGAFDDLATWTGSVVRHDDRWYLFYTGVSTKDDGAIQRINFATSTDLIHFTRSTLPPFETDPQFYEELADSTEDEESWRDPWVFFDDHEDGLAHMFFTARVNDGEGQGRGVVGHATSRDLEHWRATEPLTESGQWVGLEVPSVALIGGKWRLFFCTHERWNSRARRAKDQVSHATGTYYWSSDHKFGPYVEDGEASLLLGNPYYAGRVLRWRDEWYVVAFVGILADGTFVGELCDPLPLQVRDDGSLHVEAVLTMEQV